MYTGLFYLVLIGGFVLFFALGALYWEGSRSNDIIQAWANKNGLHLLSSQRCFFTLATPFWAAINSKNRPIYRISVEDSSGNRMAGYALCGGIFMGLWSDGIQVKWDAPFDWKRKNDDLEKPKNDFVKRKRGVDDFENPDNKLI